MAGFLSKNTVKDILNTPNEELEAKMYQDLQNVAKDKPPVATTSIPKALLVTAAIALTAALGFLAVKRLKNN